MNTKDEKSLAQQAKEELAVGIDVAVASMLGFGKRAILDRLKRKGVTQERIDKITEVADEIVEQIFDGVEKDV